MTEWMNLRICEVYSLENESRGMANYTEAEMKIKQRKMIQEKENKKQA